MKKLFLYANILIIFSCGCGKLYKIIKSSKQEDIHFKKMGQQEFLFQGNMILIPTLINEHYKTMLLDTRAPTVVFHNINNLWTDSLKFITEIGKVVSATDEKVVNQVVSIQEGENQLFKIDNWIARKMSWPNYCDNFSGIIGQDVFSQEKQLLKIDFDNNLLSIVGPTEMGKNWKELKSKFKSGNITILAKINGKEYPFGFDTGFSGSMIINTNDKGNSDLQNLAKDHFIYGHIFTTGSGKVQDTMFVKYISEISLNQNLISENVKVIESDKIRENLIGIGFIKQFNFILDYKNKKVYAQKRENYSVSEKDILAELFGAGLLESEDKLLIVALNSSGAAAKQGLKIGDEILEVNAKDMINIPECDKKEFFVDNLLIDEQNHINISRENIIMNFKIILENILE